MKFPKLGGEGWLVLIGGGEFTFGETAAADDAWLAKTPAGPIGFLPTASGSTDYGAHLATYLREAFDRETSTVPIFRDRDARRGKNLGRIEAAAAIYVGGGVVDALLETLAESPALEALARRRADGGTVVAIAAAAQAFGVAARSLMERRALDGFAWLPGVVIEPNFDPGHDRRLRELLEAPGARWGLGLPAGSAILIGPGGIAELVGPAFVIEGADGDVEPLDLQETVNGGVA